jgi:hypothetical protein
MTIREIWTSRNFWWSGWGGWKERGEHGGSSMINCAIHGKGSLIFDWTRTTKTSRSEFSHGVDYGTNDQSNEPVEPPSIITKD